MHAVSYAYGREEEGTILGILKPSCVSAVFTTFMAKYAALRKFSPDS